MAMCQEGYSEMLDLISGHLSNREIAFEPTACYFKKSNAQTGAAMISFSIPIKTGLYE